MKGIIILEGPDGAGKTTLAHAIEDRLAQNGTNVITVHNGPYHGVKGQLARLYADAMMPAIFSHSVVIMDRSWISEQVYGPVYRGSDRVGRSRARMLERLLLRVPHVIIFCLPPWETVKENFIARRHLEYLKNEEFLQSVSGRFAEFKALPKGTSPCILYDYTQSLSNLYPEAVIDVLAQYKPFVHPISWPTAGRLGAPLALVGDEFAQHHDGDCFYQWPFASLANSGCSRWLTDRLEEARVPEGDIFWVNQDANDDILKSGLWSTHAAKGQIVALGTKAAEKLQDLNIPFERIPHPQGWKRIHHFEPYPLIQFLKEKELTR